MDTIYALATAPGRAGVSVIRVSGPDAWACARALCVSLPDVGKAELRVLRKADGEILDHGLVLSFQAPASFTGEDVVEFQVHGSVAVVRAVQAALLETGRSRVAEPGEFTRRALENGKLDLAQVEGLADLIDAETETQRKQATRILSGALGEKVESWRRDLIRAAALLEATIDFADEEVPVDVSHEVRTLLAGVSAELQDQISGSFIAERVRDGFEVALVGRPNSGKSTLLNRLAGRDAAITSDIAGTTRDIIEVRMDLQGVPVTFLDTAGLRESADSIETIGIERALDRARLADRRIFLNDGALPDLLPMQSGDIELRAKMDEPLEGINGISGKTGVGVKDLLQRLHIDLSDRVSNAGLASRERHRLAMERGGTFLIDAQRLLDRGPESYDLVAEELRFCARALETLVGRVDAENLLDQIFSSFCLGK